MADFTFYHDSAGAPNFSRPLKTLDELLADIDIDAGGAPEKRIWFGSDIAGSKVEANSNPGVDQIAVSINDSNLGNSNVATRVKLATTQAGLPGAVAGASLNIGTVVNGGSANAKEIWVRYTGPANENAGVAISYTDLSLRPNALKHTPPP